MVSIQAEHMQCRIERISSSGQAPLRLKDGAILIGQAQYFKLWSDLVREGR